MDPLLIIGIIMTVTGIVVLFFGYKRSVPNTVVWALFPLLHGFHEFCDYAVEALNAPFVIERFELLFAYGSSIMLLAAAIEFNGAISRGTGKFIALILMSIAVYYFFTLSEETLDAIANNRFDFIILHSEPNRFFYGFFLVILSTLVILVSFLSLLRQSSQKKIILNPHDKAINLGAVILLIVFSVFEGFDSTNSIFIELRAVSLGIAVVIPIIFVLIAKPGLQRLLIIAESGELVYGFDFGKKADVFTDASESELNNAILTSGFLGAITQFSGQLSQTNPSFAIRTSGFYFSLLKSGSHLFALQSLNNTRTLEKQFTLFSKSLNPILLNPDDRKSHSAAIQAQVEQTFQRLY